MSVAMLVVDLTEQTSFIQVQLLQLPVLCDMVRVKTAVVGCIQSIQNHAIHVMASRQLGSNPPPTVTNDSTVLPVLPVLTIMT